MTIRCRTDAESQTVALAARLGRRLRAGDVVGLEGSLGSGKTRFVSGIAAGMGLRDADVCSPTFVICRVYRDHRPLALAHVDAFRLAGPQDLESIGWEEILAAPDTVVAVEWASRIAPALPQSRIDVTIDHTGPTGRLITISAAGEAARRLECLE